MFGGLNNSFNARISLATPRFTPWSLIDTLNIELKGYGTLLCYVSFGMKDIVQFHPVFFRRNKCIESSISKPKQIVTK